MITISVFKTSVKTDSDIKRLRPLLTSVKSISKIDFDTEDCDNILRIESQENVCSQVIELVISCGFLCEELD